MKFLGYNLFKSSILEHKFLSLRRKLDGLRQSISMDFRSSSDNIKIPHYPLSLETLYDTAKASDVLTIIFNSLKEEIFRNGYDFKPAFVRKCTNKNCGKEFDEDVKVCDVCDSETRIPSIENVESLEKQFQMGINLNKQTLLDVLKQIEDDLQTVDNGYLIVLKDYNFNAYNELVTAKVREMIRGNPNLTHIVANKYGVPSFTDEGEEILTCVEHRDEFWLDKEFCPKCNKKLYPVVYYSNFDDNKTYYIEGEILHISKYNPSLLYGYSAMFSVWQKVVTLFAMDTYMMQYYQKQKSPKSLVFVNTNNQDSLTAAWKDLLEQVKINPHMTKLLAIESNSNQGNVAQVIDLMKPLNEMQYVETRNEMRRQIGAVFGVMPIYQGDLSSGGGLNNEGLQITVTNRAVERGQMLYNNKILPFILRQFGITDYVLELNPNEEQDEMAEEELSARKISNARMMLDMGFEVKLKGKEFQFTGEAIPDVAKPLSDPFKLPQQDKIDYNDSQQGFTGSPQKTLKYNKNVSIYKAFKVLWESEQDEIEKHLDMNIITKAQDMTIDALSDQMFSKSFDDLTKAQSDKLKDIMMYGFTHEQSIIEISKTAERELGKEVLTASQLERIVRTEHTAIRNKMREVLYDSVDPTDKLKYKWIGPTDHRTTSICETIKRKTKSGVSLKELKRIVNEESQKGGFEPRDFTPHINCRHTFVSL